MNLEHAIELVSVLESQILKSKDGDSAKYGQTYGSVAMYKTLVQIVNFIDEECTNDYGLRSLIKKFNDIKNVMACELYKKFLLLDFTKDFYINTEILASVSLIYGNLYRTSLINEFCSKALSHMMGQVESVGAIEGPQYIKKFVGSFSQLIDSDKVDMFSDDWNISYYLYVEFRRCVGESIKNLENIKMSDIVDIANTIREVESHIKETLIKKNSSFAIDHTMCQFFDDNQYCSNLYLDGMRQEITKMKEILVANFTVKYNTGSEEYNPSYKTKIQPFITALDLFSFIKKLFGYTTKVSSGKIFKTTCNEIFGLLKHYGTLLLSHTNIVEEKGFNKISEFALFNVISTCNYCMNAIDSMDISLKLTELGIPVEKIKVFYSTQIFLKTIDVLAKENVTRQKKHTKKLQSTSFISKPDKKEQERSKIVTEVITEYMDEILIVYGDTTHAFIGKVLKGLEDFCFPFAFKIMTFQMIDGIQQDMLGLRNVAPKYHTHLFVIFERLMERIHSLFNDPLCTSITKFQPDIDLRLTKINKILDAIAISTDYELTEHNQIFGNEVQYDTILQIKGQSSLINIPSLPSGTIPSMPSMPNIPTMPSASMPNMKTVTDNSVTNAMKGNAEKLGTFITGAFGTITGKDKDKSEKTTKK